MSRNAMNAPYGVYSTSSYAEVSKKYLAQQNEAVRQTIEAGYHCAWTMDEIMTKVRELGSPVDRATVEKLYHALHDSIKAEV